jgi:protein STE50
MEDPCYKVLPAALKKYNINAPWEQYALYIVYGDQERCLGMDEKPLILFKQLDKEGKKPMFMLRKMNANLDAQAVEGLGSAGLDSRGTGRVTHQSTSMYDPPGGVL